MVAQYRTSCARKGRHVINCPEQNQRQSGQKCQSYAQNLPLPFPDPAHPSRRANATRFPVVSRLR